MKARKVRKPPSNAQKVELLAERLAIVAGMWMLAGNQKLAWRYLCVLYYVVLCRKHVW